jgi:hypothetical protein
MLPRRGREGEGEGEGKGEGEKRDGGGNHEPGKSRGLRSDGAFRQKRRARQMPFSHPPSRRKDQTFSTPHHHRT